MEFTSYRYRIYPNREQREFFELNFYCCTLVWNLMREDKARHYLESGKILQTTPAQYKKKYPVLSRADSMALCNVQQNLQNAYNRFFSNVENQIRGGYPREKYWTVSGRKSYTTSCIRRKNYANIRVGQGSIWLPKCGNVKAAVHRHAPDGWELKSATVIREPDGRYYCSVLYRCPDPPPPLPLTPGRSRIGICACPGALCMDSGGTVYAFPDGYGAAVERYHKARAAMEGKRGSRNGQTPSNHYRKLEKKAAGLRRHADDMLRDALHRLSHSLAGRYEIICAADGKAHMADGSPYAAADTDCLPVQEKLSSLSGRSYTQLLDMLEYKQRRKGHHFIRVDAEDLPADSTGRQDAAAILEAGMRRLSESSPGSAQDSGG